MSNEDMNSLIKYLAPTPRVLHSIACACGLSVAIFAIGHSVQTMMLRDRAIESLTLWCQKSGSCAGIAKNAMRTEFSVYSDKVTEANLILNKTIGQNVSALLTSALPNIVPIPRGKRPPNFLIRSGQTNRIGSAA